MIVDKPDAVQTEIRVGQLAIPRKHPGLPRDGPRDEDPRRRRRATGCTACCGPSAGLTYGASADMQSLKQAGDFVADTDTRTETTAEVLRLIVDEIHRSCSASA